MPHIHTEPGQIDHTVTAYIIRTDGDEPRALLHMHKKLHHLLPVGGHIELHETPWAAVVHEIEEEAGYQIEDLMILQPKARIDTCPDIVVHPTPFFANTHAITDRHYHSDVAYIFTSRTAPTQLPADAESQDVRWFTRKEIAELAEGDILENIKHTYLAVFDVFLKAYEPVSTSSYVMGVLHSA